MDHQGIEVGDYEYFTDDVKMIHDMLKDNWDTYPMEKPVFAYTPEQWQTSARNAFIYVYQISRYNSVSSMDYSTLQRTSFIAIRSSARNRDVFHKVVDEVYKILLAHRRIGMKALHGYGYLEIINDRSSNELTGWYSNTLDVKLTSYIFPTMSDGFGVQKEDSENL